MKPAGIDTRHLVAQGLCLVHDLYRIMRRCSPVMAAPGVVLHCRCDEVGIGARPADAIHQDMLHFGLGHGSEPPVGCWNLTECSRSAVSGVKAAELRLVGTNPIHCPGKEIES